MPNTNKSPVPTRAATAAFRLASAFLPVAFSLPEPSWPRSLDAVVPALHAALPQEEQGAQTVNAHSSEEFAAEQARSVLVRADCQVRLSAHASLPDDWAPADSIPRDSGLADCLAQAGQGELRYSPDAPPAQLPLAELLRDSLPGYRVSLTLSPVRRRDP